MKKKILVDCNASQHRVPFVQVLTSWVKVRFSCLIVTPSPYKTTDLSNLDTRMLSMCVCVLWEQKIKPFLKSGPQTHFLRSFKWDLSKIWHTYLLKGKIQICSCPVKLKNWWQLQKQTNNKHFSQSASIDFSVWLETGFLNHRTTDKIIPKLFKISKF